MTGNGKLIDTVPLAQCNRAGCPRFGIRAMCLMVPYENKTEREMNGLRLFIGIKLCEQHAKECKAVDIVNPGMERAVIRAALERGRPKPDFSRSMINSTTLDDPRYLDYLEHVQAAQNVSE